MVLYFCVWGEAANVRHMPECLCYLYHKSSLSYVKATDEKRAERSLYQGYYLDKVIFSIVDVVGRSMRETSKDHVDRRNYDDFNEFFWTSKCLKYKIFIDDDDDDDDGGDDANNGTKFVDEGLRDCPKTFQEKRSWLTTMLSLNRVIEWNVITFYFLTVIAFARALVWGWVYAVQVGSGVFLLMNFLHLLWSILDVWSVTPNIELSGTAVTGHVLSLSTRFLVLAYQTDYLSRAFGEGTGGSMNFDADASFWWWQYVWLSAVVMVPYAIEAVFQLWPYSSTLVYSSSNDYVQSFLNVVYPMSRLYVGKRVHETIDRSCTYILFWVTLLTWKLLFSYHFEVACMVLPTLELSDDYYNYPDQSFYKMASLIVIRWIPQFVVYTIDTSIWYALWQAFAGTTVGFDERLGDIKNFEDIRGSFTKAPDAFCSKLICSPELNFGSSSNMLEQKGGGKKQARTTVDEMTSLLGGRGEPANAGYAGTAPSFRESINGATSRLLDVRIQKWVFFGEVWNEIIDHFRDEDIVSNREMNYLKFSRFRGSGHTFKMPIYLPVFQTAGVIDLCISEIEGLFSENAHNHPFSSGGITDEDFFSSFTSNITMQTSASEVWELGCYLCKLLLGPVHENDTLVIFDTVSEWTTRGGLTGNVDMSRLRTVVSSFAGLVSVLANGLGRRSARKAAGGEKKQDASAAKEESDAPPVASQAAAAAPSKDAAAYSPNTMRRAVSTNHLSTLQSTLQSSSMSSVSRSRPRLRPRGNAMKKAPAQKVVIIDALRDQIRDKLRSFAHSVKSILKKKNLGKGKDLGDRLTFLLSMENGFLWNDAYASGLLDKISTNKLFCEVLNKVHGLINTHPDDVEPKSKEAKRRLTFFVNSLFMDLPFSPSIKDMQSWNVMTPFYSEDVTYSKAELTKKEKTLGVSVLLYLQTLYPADWSNFLERLGIKDEERIWDPSFADEVRRWASLRAQTLSRTVSGMMLNEKALRLLAKLEGLDGESINDLICEKFGYVLACQVYGVMKKNQDSKADDIENLMHRFPHMRVAYIDNVKINRDGDSAFYSVLIKSDGQGGVQEIYRVRLPGNPVIGEGKPENQNHAIVFTRGEYLQTIDMNQEAYFEEALKMRNLLEEFAREKRKKVGLPTTILGFREHIFTGSVSSLANYMALQETSFVTLGQRVLNKPLCSRLHYGHPDIFDKLFFMTRGGVSKASKGINLSEDIFAGYNNVVRGGSVKFKEYVQVGKGRDVGGQQIYKFEAKLSQGNAEQSISRDVYRMARRLDFFRLFSMYFGGIGHYCGNVLTVLTVYIVTYLMLGLALFDCEKIGDRKITPSGTLQMLLGGLGLMNTVPLFATLGVERGWWSSFSEIYQVFVTGGPLHFMFHIQTKAHYFAQTILVGGAKYRATGRGFVTQHSPFAENFRFFASSHLYLGFELASALVLMAGKM